MGSIGVDVPDGDVLVLDKRRPKFPFGQAAREDLAHDGVDGNDGYLVGGCVIANDEVNTGGGIHVVTRWMMDGVVLVEGDARLMEETDGFIDIVVGDVLGKAETSE